MTAPAGDLLPTDARAALAGGNGADAGERLLEYAENLARSEPGEAHKWAMPMADLAVDDRLFTAYARWAAGVALYLSGDIKAAERPLREAARRLSAMGHETVADRVRLVMIDLHGERFEVDRARRLATRLNRRFRERGDSERAASALINLACAEDAADRVARARDLWRLARRDLEDGSFRRLVTDANLCNVAALEGRFADASEGLEQVAETARAQGLEGFAVQTDLNLAEVEFVSGLVDAAFARWHRVIENSRSSGNAVIEVTAEIDCAEAEATLGDLSGARDRLGLVVPRAAELGLEREHLRGICLGAVLDAADGAFDGWRRVVGELRGRHVAVQRDLLKVDVAQLDPTCDPVLVCRAARRLVRSGHTQRGRLGLAWSARRYLDRGRVERARDLARESLQGRQLSPWTRMVAHHVLGRIGGTAGLRHLSLAARSADRVHGRLSATADRQAFLLLRNDVYLDLLAVLLDRNRPADRKRALSIAGRLRAGYLLDELDRRVERGDDPLIHRWQELRFRLAALLHEVEGGDEPRVRRSGLKLHQTIQAVERDLRRTEVELARRWPIGETHGTRQTAERLIRTLPPRDTFVEYTVHRGDLVVFRIRAGQLTVRRLANCEAALGELLDSVRFHMDAHTWLGDGAPATHGAALDDRLHRLSEMLLSSVAIDDTDRLWIAPHADLAQLPWAALPDGDGRRLVDRTPITLVPGADAAGSLLEERPRRPRSVAIGGSPAAGLPLVEREVADLAEVHPGATVAHTATRQGFLDLLASNELVHLAGHAVFLDGLPFASGLRLSDGYVTVRDLAASRLAARFVTFGVCSGLRLGRERGQRHAGFVLALMNGGVRTVVGPVAPVRDEVAYEFDLAFHTGLRETRDPGAAFRTAISAVRGLDPRPATWGSFSMYGDPRGWEDG